MNQPLQDNDVRVLARDTAQELTESEAKQVAGGTGIDCHKNARITFTKGEKPDVDAMLDCVG